MCAGTWRGTNGSPIFVRSRDGKFFRIKLLLFNIMIESEINRLVALCEGLTQILYLFGNSRADADCIFGCAVVVVGAAFGGGGAWHGSTTNRFVQSHKLTIRMVLYCCHLFSTRVRASSTFLGALHAQIISPSMGCIRHPHKCRTDLQSTKSSQVKL